MKAAMLAPAFRLPLMAVLVINVAVVLVTPLHRARLAAHQEPSGDPTADTFDSPSGDRRSSTESLPDEQPAPPSRSAASSAGDRNVERVADGTRASATAPENEPPPETAVAPSKPPAAPKRFFTIGETIAELDHSSQTFGRPVATAAARLSRWLAQGERSVAVPGTRTGLPGSSLTSHSSRAAAESGESDIQVIIRNPQQNAYPVAFLLNDQVRTLPPGAELALPTDRATLRFDRGGSFGEAQYDLDPGVYSFGLGSHGWTLQRQSGSRPSALRSSPR